MDSHLITATTPETQKFRAKVEELKLRTKCNRCGSVGHWARGWTQKSSRNYEGGGRRNQPWKKNEHFVKKTEMRMSATGVVDTNRGFRISLTADTPP